MDSCKKRRTNCHRHWISVPWWWELCICEVKISPVFSDCVSRSLCLSLKCLGVCCQTKQKPKEFVELLCSSTKVIKAPVTFKSWLRGRFVAITCKGTGTGWWWQETLHWWHDKNLSIVDGKELGIGGGGGGGDGHHQCLSFVHHQVDFSLWGHCNVWMAPSSTHQPSELKRYR